MPIKSPFPNPPAVPPTNAYNFLYNREDQKEWPKDFTAHVDSSTGKKKLFSELKTDVKELGTALGAPTSQGGLGLSGDGEIIGIMGENSSEYITLIQSLLMITTPFALISSYSTAFELKHALRLSKATRVFVDGKYLPLMLRVAKQVGIPASKVYVLCGHVRARKSVQDFIFDAWKKKIPPVDARPVTKDTLAYFVFSSGTTGLPKAVMISHHNIVFSMLQTIVVSQVTTAAGHVAPPPKTPEGIPVVLAFLPLHHSYGLHMYALRSMLVPCTLVMMPKWNLDIALKFIPQYRVSILTLIPSIVVQLLNHPKFAETDLSSLATAGCGAAYLPAELGGKLAKILPKDASLSEGYGLSECTISALGQPTPGVLGIHVPTGSAGVLNPGTEARVVKEDGSDATVGEVGELWLKGENNALGYWGVEGAKSTRETFVDGWLRTGDQFWVDAKGCFFFADRAKDTLKVSGSQVSPVEIENVLLSHPDKLIADVSVAGVSGGRTDDEKVPRAWIVLSDSGKRAGKNAVVKELDGWHRGVLSKYKWLRGGIEVVDDIPKLPTGKVLRRVLVERYEKERGGRRGGAKL